MCSHLPGFPLSAAVPVGMGVAIVAVLRLPLSAVVLATLLTSHAGPKVEPLIIVGVVVSYVVTLVDDTPAGADDGAGGRIPLRRRNDCHDFSASSLLLMSDRIAVRVAEGCQDGSSKTTPTQMLRSCRASRLEEARGRVRSLSLVGKVSTVTKRTLG